jgi:hypothetical protein
MLDGRRVTVGTLRLTLDVDTGPVDRLDGVDREEAPFSIWSQQKTLLDQDNLVLERNEETVRA